MFAYYNDESKLCSTKETCNGGLLRGKKKDSVYYYCTWKKVRHIPKNNGKWFPTHDRLKGFE